MLDGISDLFPDQIHAAATKSEASELETDIDSVTEKAWAGGPEKMTTQGFS